MISQSLSCHLNPPYSHKVTLVGPAEAQGTPRPEVPGHVPLPLLCPPPECLQTLSSAKQCQPTALANQLPPHNTGPLPWPIASTSQFLSAALTNQLPLHNPGLLPWPISFHLTNTCSAALANQLLPVQLPSQLTAQSLRAGARKRGQCARRKGLVQGLGTYIGIRGLALPFGVRN